MSHQTVDYEEIIRSAGYRLTHQRTLILDAVCVGGGHTTLGEIYARIRKFDPSIDVSTVYRALKLFVKLQLVVAADTGTGETYYEIARAKHHHHLVCRTCGHDQEIDDTALQGLFEAVATRYNFAVGTDHLVLFGVCGQCQTSN